MIKIIAFDIGGTLIDISNKINEYSFSDLSKIINKSYDETKNAYKKVFQKTKGDFNTLIDLFCKELNIKVSDELLVFFQSKFKPSNDIPNVSDDKVKVISKLKDMGYKIILISNTSALDSHNLPNKLTNLIENIFYSYELGFNKNEDECYRIIEKEMNCKANEFLIIGDTLDSDYYVPIKNGWNALYYGKSDNNIKFINKFEDIFKYL